MTVAKTQNVAKARLHYHKPISSSVKMRFTKHVMPKNSDKN